MLGVLGSLAVLSRDQADYWNHKPRDHNGAGLFVIGPQEKRPSWPYKVKTGEANRAPETESREAILAREAEAKRNRVRRLTLGVTGVFTGRNRRAA